MPKLVRYIIPVLILALIAALAVRQHRRSFAEEGIYSGTIEAEESRIGSTVGGRVAATLAREGDSIHKGQRLVTFESDELAAALDAAMASERQASDRLRDLRAGARPEEIDRANAAVAQARNQYEKLRRGSRPEEIVGAKAAMDQAKQRYLLLQHGPRKEDIDRAQAVYEAAEADRELADASYKRIEGLFQQGAVAAQARDEAQARARVALANETAAKRQFDALKAGNRIEDIRAARDTYNQARATYALVKMGPRREDIAGARDALRQSQAALAELKAGTRPYQIAQAEGALHQARASVDQVKTRVRERAVFAPRSGRLEVLNVQPGDIVSPGQPVGTVIDPRDLYIRFYVSEREIAGLRVGARLQVVTDAGVRVTGSVEQIPVRAEFTPRNVQTKDERALQVYAVKVRLPNPGLELRAGMSAEVTFNHGSTTERETRK